jgi:hypothetical protein
MNTPFLSSTCVLAPVYLHNELPLSPHAGTEVKYPQGSARIFEGNVSVRNTFYRTPFFGSAATFPLWRGLRQLRGPHSSRLDGREKVTKSDQHQHNQALLHFGNSFAIEMKKFTAWRALNVFRDLATMTD